MNDWRKIEYRLPDPVTSSWGEDVKFGLGTWALVTVALGSAGLLIWALFGLLS